MSTFLQDILESWNLILPQMMANGPGPEAVKPVKIKLPPPHFPFGMMFFHPRLCPFYAIDSAELSYSSIHFLITQSTKPLSLLCFRLHFWRVAAFVMMFFHGHPRWTLTTTIIIIIIGFICIALYI